MFYNSDEELKNIVDNAGTAIICEKNTDALVRVLKNPIIIKEHTIEAMREAISMTVARTTTPRYFIFEHAEKLTEESQNASLKLLEEPKQNYHFILQTSSPEELLPTIRSRAPIYAPLVLNSLELPPDAEKEVFNLAKRLLVADTAGVIDIAEELQKKKETEKVSRRDFALSVIKTTIELAEKSYFKTENEAFVKKINGLILAYKNIELNGSIRLQLIANLV